MFEYHRYWLLSLICLAMTQLFANEQLPDVRELWIPFDQLNVVLEAGPDRVFLPRNEYEELLQAARKKEVSRAPQGAVAVSGSYHIAAEKERALITGRIRIEVLEDGLHALPFQFSGVGLRRARLDQEPAPLLRSEADGRIYLLIEGKGWHDFQFTAAAPLQTTAARQVLNFRLPALPSATMTLRVEGDVDLKSGAAVLSRIYEAEADETRFEILPSAGHMSLVLSLNSRLKRKDRVVIARTVIVDEFTEAYEQLHLTASFDILHRAVDTFHFTVPDGFEVIEVATPNLARWSIQEEEQRTVLEVVLREETQETVVVAVKALRTRPELEGWSLPQLQPLDTAGTITVLGLLLDERLDIRHVAEKGLIPIDSRVLTHAMARKVTVPHSGQPALRPLLSFYAPGGDFLLSADFVRAPATLRVRTNTLLTVGRQGLRAQGGFALLVEEEERFALNFTMPPDWDLLALKTSDGQVLPFQLYENEQRPRFHITLPRGIAPGREETILFEAHHVPKGWFEEWQEQTIAFPAFVLQDTVDETGAVAVAAEDDMRVRPSRLEGLMPLNENEKPEYGLAGIVTDLAYRYDSPPYIADLVIDHIIPRVTLESITFFQLNQNALSCHNELLFDVSQAGVRELFFTLPLSTPAALSISGMMGTVVQEFQHSETDDVRLWSVQLTEPAAGSIKLAVDFQQNLPETDSAEIDLPFPKAVDAEYQTGRFAVEGNPELDVRIVQHPRKVDIGELVDAEYKPGAQLLGAYEYTGEPPTATIAVSRPASAPMPAAIIQRAELATVISATGLTQNSARFLLHTKPLFLEIRLPENSVLWSVILDNRPVAPQQENGRILLDLSTETNRTTRELKVTYETPVRNLLFLRQIAAQAPALAFHSADGEIERTVPQVEMHWNLFTPTGYRIARIDGTMTPVQPVAEQLAAVQLPALLYKLSGGISFDDGLISIVTRTPHFLVAIVIIVVIVGGIIYARQKRKEIGVRGCLSSLVTVLVVLLLLAVLAGMLLPSLSQSREKARLINCAGNLKQIGLALRMYSSDNQEHFPPSFAGLAEQGYLTNNRVYGCPETMNPAPSPANSDYTYLGAGLTESITNPERTVIAYHQHEGMTNILFVDGHVKGYAAPSVHDAIARNNLILPNQISLDSATRFSDMDVAREEVEVRRKSFSGKAREIKQSTPAGMPTEPAWAIEGTRSLEIQLTAMGAPLVLRALGADQELSVTLIHSRRMQALALAVGLTVLLAGLLLTHKSRGAKLRFLAVVFLISISLPLLPWLDAYVPVLNAAFYAACIAAVYFLILRTISSFSFNSSARRISWFLVLACFGAGLTGMSSLAAAEIGPEEEVHPGAGSNALIVQVPPEPVTLPEDAVIVPYDAAEEPEERESDQVWISRKHFQELWEKAHSEEDADTKQTVAVYALSGLLLQGTLVDDDVLQLDAELDFHVFTDTTAEIALPLAGAVITSAEVDGRPANLRAAAVEPRPDKAASQQQLLTPRPASLIVLTVSGKGQHRLTMQLRIKLQRRGGWRVAQGLFPVAPASSLRLTVPKAGTSILLQHVPDQHSHETETDAEVIEAALAATGQLRLEWRPAVAEAQVDHSLTVQSEAQFDVTEAGLRLNWLLKYDFRRGEREFFNLRLPDGYLVEQVSGTNIRGWEINAENADSRSLDVQLLKPARDSEQFSIALLRQIPVASSGKERLEVPLLTVPEAAQHTGKLTLRRSPALEIQITEATGLTRVDVEDIGKPIKHDAPLGLQLFQAYEFAALPFMLQMTVQRGATRIEASVNSILRIAQRERVLESALTLTVHDRPLYSIEILVPALLDIDKVNAGEASEWAVTQDGGRKLLTVYFSEGRTGKFLITLKGRYGSLGEVQELQIPILKLVDLEDQQGVLVVQADPIYEVHAADLDGLQLVPLQRVSDWLQASQRQLAQLALQYRTTDCRGTLLVRQREAEVSCHTVTNVRVTDRLIEYTALLDFTIRKAGIQEVRFRIPAEFADARVEVPLLRRKIVTPLENDKGVLLTLQLQDRVMNELRVIVQHEQLLTSGTHAIVPPEVKTGRTDRRYMIIESAGRDEVVVSEGSGFEPLSRQRQEWQLVNDLLRGGASQAFIIPTRLENPVLRFQTRQRTTVETAGARIGLAECLFVLDGNGAYRAVQTYHIDNQTEQFLEIRLPAGSELWSARVAGQLVKPRSPEKEAQNLLHIPLVKTAAGDLDYKIVLKYAGRVSVESIWGNVEFPFLQAGNINVERSQVELRLPHDQSWFQFDGNMRRVQEAGDFQAGFLEYKTKLAERLLRTMQFGSKFEKARAYSNVKTLGRSLQQTQQDISVLSVNEDVAQQMAQSQKVIAQVQQEMKLAEGARQEVQFNADTLNVVFEKQKNTLAANQVLNLSDNWVPEAAETSDEATDKFSAEWLVRNRLAAQPDQHGDEKAHQTGAEQLVKEKVDEMKATRKEPAPEWKGQKAPQVVQSLRERDASKPASAPKPDTAASRYEEKLEAQAGRRTARQQLFSLDRVDKDDTVPTSGAAVSSPQGLVSLDFDLPAFDGSRWSSYRFTTPRGTVAVEAQRVSRAAIDWGRRLAAALAVLLVMWLIFHAITHSVQKDKNYYSMSPGILAIAGIIGILFGFLPWLSLTLIVISGLWFLVRRLART